MSDWAEHMASMLGKEVRVTLDYDDPDPRAIARGKLLRFSEDGEVVVLHEDGTMHWCWPALKCEVVT